MKKRHVLFVVLLGVTSLAAAAPKEKTSDTVDWAKAEQNYKANLHSDNYGVITSAANYIRKYKLTGAVEDLKTLLTGDESENVKMSAALALVSIGGSEGKAAVEQALQKEENEVVAAFYRSVLHTAEDVNQ